MLLRRLAAAALAVCLPAAHAALPELVAAALAAQGLPESSISAIVIRGNTIVLDQQAARPMRPASVMKLVTTAVGLEHLGPVFKGRTELVSNAPVVGDTLQGDLVLRGGADVDLTTATLERMLHTLRSQGIRRIAGNLVVDRSLFTPARLDVGVPPFDESPEAYYNVIPDAAIINRNMIDIDMRSTAKGIKFSVWPDLDRVSVTSDMKLIDGECAKWEDGWKLPEYQRDASGRLKIVLHGTYPKNCAQTNSINVLDRQDYTDRLFRALWKRQGGQLKGNVVDGVAPADAKLLAEHVSRPLAEILRDINKPSDNEIARTVFLSLGSLQPDAALGSKPLPVDGVGSTLVRADAVVRAWMHEHGISDDGLILENGSGLSRIERVSPQQLAGILQAALKSNWAPEFQSSLPIAGVDGTMRRRLKDSPAAQRARVKTGTLRDTIANAGYVLDANGQVCILAAIINDPNTGNGKGRAVLDALIDWVARSAAPAQ